jgi:hypothetical protein
MFRIDYKIITARLDKTECISDEEIRYNFLLGNVSFISSNAEIEMEWEWIPLLDFVYCLQIIVNSLKAKNTAKEYFEFTENAETLEFSKHGQQLKIVASFSPIVVETIFADFTKAVYGFHFNISKYVQTNTVSKLSCNLHKYLLAEI